RSGASQERTASGRAVRPHCGERYHGPDRGVQLRQRRTRKLCGRSAGREPVDRGGQFGVDPSRRRSARRRDQIAAPRIGWNARQHGDDGDHHRRRRGRRGRPCGEEDRRSDLPPIMADHRSPVRPEAASDQPAPPLTYVPEGDVHILDRLAVIYRYRRVAAAVFALATAAILIQNYTSVKLFRAQARLLIEDERSTAVPGVSADNYYEDPDLYYKTQYRILKGRDLTRRVVRKLNVAAIPEFNGTAAPPATPLTLLRQIETRAGVLVRPDAEPARKTGEAPSESALVDAFIGRVDVEPVPGSKLV